MSDIEGGHDPTAPFFAVLCFAQLALGFAWVIAIATIRRQQRLAGRRTVALAVAIAGEVLVPLAWNLLVPVRDVLPINAFACLIQVLIGSALTGALWSLSRLWSVRSDAYEVWPRGSRNRAFIAVGLAGLGLWMFWTVNLLAW